MNGHGGTCPYHVTPGKDDFHVVPELVFSFPPLPETPVPFLGVLGDLAVQKFVKGIISENCFTGLSVRRF
jgi:hypothetical protein